MRVIKRQDVTNEGNRTNNNGIGTDGVQVKQYCYNKGDEWKQGCVWQQSSQISSKNAMLLHDDSSFLLQI